MLQHRDLSSETCDKQQSCLSAPTTLQNLHPNVQSTVICNCLAHLSAQIRLQHLDLSWSKRVTDRVIARLSGLILLQHLDLSFWHDKDQRRPRDIEGSNEGQIGVSVRFLTISPGIQQVTSRGKVNKSGFVAAAIRELSVRLCRSKYQMYRAALGLLAEVSGRGSVRARLVPRRRSGNR
jgi:hypothetical protein